MDSFLAIALSALSAYLIGSIPTSFIFAKTILGIDIRQAGSKNAGATNVFRVVGKLPGILTLVIDILKGVLVVTLVAGYSYRFIDTLDFQTYRAFLGFITVCGHIWPVFLKFRGGKGVATTLGVGIVIAPWVLLATICIWLAVFAVSSYVSLASVVSLTIFPIMCVLLDLGFSVTIFSVIICTMVIVKHKANIMRLVARQENKTHIFGK